MSTEEKKPLLKYELPKGKGEIIVGTEGNGFYVYFKNEITKRESMSIFDTSKEAMAKTENLFNMYKGG